MRRRDRLVQVLQPPASGRPTGSSPLGIAVVHDGPGRRNLQDHLQLRADLQGLRRQDAERDLLVVVRRGLMGFDYALAPARAAHHGAVAVRHLHALRSGPRERQHPVPCAAAVARQVRRSAAPHSPPSPSAPAICGRPSRGTVRIRSADARDKHPRSAELPVKRGGPPRRGRLHQLTRKLVKQRRSKTIGRRSICPAHLSRRRCVAARRPAISARRSSIPSAPPRWAWTATHSGGRAAAPVRIEGLRVIDASVMPTITSATPPRRPR